MARVELTARPHEIEDVWLGDDGPFQFVAPKTGRILSALVTGKRGKIEADGVMEANLMKAQVDWLKDGFHEDDWQHIVDRIDNADDVLDWEHLIGEGASLFEQLFGKASGRPFTSSGDSTSTPRKSTGGVAPKPRAKISGTTPPEDSAT